ncbi:MAG: hypothetical protein A2339_07810 [Elusimicrobia bacterium RIFOXYB12_FULL_50_12]|nr:MAG: hypothetical protein A2278_02920 [Elusimicrobia bacterium RIFOXYA12_FULL_49_49]OGS10694.1 MAG: hypothetical protein A2386_07920 [Elusimicrobia bacterium RIFOXYB1_FULL_48_9]OGS16434.1 MAG: hypothetical protein A2251_06375 [Elusimicrobia bacterium RIFOXYA2_FULL_47_53]OGS27191.1 MAG: hypothetical protein A2339_07810 [Elusimicrobia bacterium RIFOXYB12_FULL_50_12]OGS30390.1 MAG: hypothetical protein A2323_02670 [Elusimicrobia bacterium RIFOXYB2_FULL_46_23]
MDKLSELQLDALREICSVGAGNAATAISKMLGKKVDMSVPDIKLVPVARVSELIGGAETLVVGVYSRIMGDLTGEFLLTFPRESAYSLTDILLKKSPGDTKVLEDMDRSALEETGNIITGTFVNALAKILDKNLLISVPKLAFDMAGAIIDFVLIELSEVAEFAVVLEIVFHDIPETIRGKFFILPDPKSLELIISLVKEERLA